VPSGIEGKLMEAVMNNWKNREKKVFKNILIHNLILYFILSMGISIFGSEKNDTVLEAIIPDSIQSELMDKDRTN